MTRVGCAVWLGALWLGAGAVPAVTQAASDPAGPATGGPAVAVVVPDRVVPAAALREDTALLRRAYETLHPGLYRYRSRSAIDAAFAELDAAFQRDRRLSEAYLAFARFTTVVQCGHSYPNFFNQGDTVQQAVLRRPRLPFEFRWIDRRMVITRALTEAGDLPRGTEVLSIDGQPVATILQALLPYSRADGSNDAKRISNLEVTGEAEFEAFNVYFPLVFPRDESRPFVLRVRTVPGGRVTEHRVAAVPAARRQEEGTKADKDANPWSYAEVRPGIGLLRMPTWAMYNSKFAWEAYLDQLFTDLARDGGPRDLIIDLRGNEGGSAVGDRLLAHLIAQPLPADPIVRKTRYRKVPDDLRPYLQTWDKSFYDWGDAAQDLGDGFYRLTSYDNDPAGTIVRPLAPRYTGRVWVLIGAANSSATFEFASAVRRARLGTLVGQSTGGNQRGITGGAFFFLRLPHSGIEVDVPLIGQFPVSAKPLPDAGLEPDVYVTPSLADVAAGRDAELAATFERIDALRR